MLKLAKGVPSQVMDMNENVRELVITPSMRQSRTVGSKSFDKDNKASSGLSHTTKGFLGNTPIQLGQALPQTEMTTSQ